MLSNSQVTSQWSRHGDSSQVFFVLWSRIFFYEVNNQETSTQMKRNPLWKVFNHDGDAGAFNSYWNWVRKVNHLFHFYSVLAFLPHKFAVQRDYEQFYTQ